VEPTVAFVVRVTLGEAPELRGTVERVRTGEKHHFQDLESLGRLLAEMVGPAPLGPGTGSEEPA
jgi:hypothetical protein